MPTYEDYLKSKKVIEEFQAQLENQLREVKKTLIDLSAIHFLNQITTVREGHKIKILQRNDKSVEHKKGDVLYVEFVKNEVEDKGMSGRVYIDYKTRTGENRQAIFEWAHYSEWTNGKVKTITIADGPFIFKVD